MAGTITHAYFSMDLYDRLSIRSKELLMDYKPHLRMFSQSTDVFYIYNLLSLKKGEKVRRFASFTHNEKSYEFLSTLVNYIKYNNYMYNPEVMAYLYGMLSHYVLDSTFHPYVYYKTGVYYGDKKETRKYKMLHPKLENYFDNYLVKLREGIKARKFKCHKFCFSVDNIGKDLKDVIDFTHKEVFNIDSFSKIYIRAWRQNKTYFHLLKYDKHGLKRKLYLLIDKLFPNLDPGCEATSYATKPDKKWLNLEHNTWYNPIDKRIKSNKSLIELYTSALDKTVKMIEELNKYIYYDKKINLKEVIGNLSYTTGLDCSKGKELKYFEF